MRLGDERGEIGGSGSVVRGSSGDRSDLTLGEGEDPMRRDTVIRLATAARKGGRGALPALVAPAALALLVATSPARADSSMINTATPITGGVEVHLIYTDADGKKQDYSLTSAPLAVLSALTPQMQAAAKLPLLKSPAFFVGSWSLTDKAVCQDIVKQVEQTINTSDDQAYDVSCKPMPVGLLHAQVQTTWETNTVALRGQPASPGGFLMGSGRRLALEYYVPPFNRVTMTVTTPWTCQASKAWWGCAADPKYGLLYDVALQMLVTSSDPNSFKLPLKAIPTDAVTMQAMLDGAAYEKQVDAAASKFETQLAVDAGSAIVDWYASLIAAVVQAIKLLVTNAGALVADAANTHLRDWVSSSLSFLASPSAGKAVTDLSISFNALFDSMQAESAQGFTQLDIVEGTKHSLQFRLTYPTPAKPQLENKVAASNKGIHLSPASIGTGGQQVRPGAPFLVNGNNFMESDINAVSISWTHTIAGIGKVDMQWGPKGGAMQDTPVALGSYTPENLKAGTLYQFRVHECDYLTCAPWSDWLEVKTGGSGSNKLTLWLDGDSGHPIATNTIQPNGSFDLQVSVPAGTTSGAHILNAAMGAITTKAEGTYASTPITVCAAQGCGPSLSVMNTAQTALKPPINLLYPSTPTLRGDNFAPGVAVTVHLDSGTGSKLGSATPNKLGIFEGKFQIPMAQSGNHKLVAIQAAPKSPLQAVVEVNLASQPK
jgi:hypothetical protein